MEVITKNCRYQSSIFLVMKRLCSKACMMKLKKKTAVPCTDLLGWFFFPLNRFYSIPVESFWLHIFNGSCLTINQPVVNYLSASMLNGLFWQILWQTVSYWTVSFTDCFLNRLFFPYPLAVYQISKGVDLLSQSVSLPLLVWKQRWKAGLQYTGTGFFLQIHWG